MTYTHNAKSWFEAIRTYRNILSKKPSLYHAHRLTADDLLEIIFHENYVTTDVTLRNYSGFDFKITVQIKLKS